MDDQFLQPEIPENTRGVVRFGLGSIAAITGGIGYFADAYSNHVGWPTIAWTMLAAVGLYVTIRNWRHVPRYR